MNNDLSPVYIHREVKQPNQLVYLRIPSLRGYEFDQYMCLVASNVKTMSRAQKTLLSNQLRNGSLLDRLKIEIVMAIQKTNKLDVTITIADIVSYILNPIRIPNNGDKCIIHLDPEVINKHKCGNHNFLIKSIGFLFYRPVNTKSVDNPIRKYIDAAVTSALCQFDEIYNISSYYFKLLIVDLCHYDVNICNLILRNKIIFEMKGSMAIKRYLLMLFPERIDEIMKTFPNGDNDTSILIDPGLPDFDAVRHNICTFLYQRMYIYVDRLFEDIRVHCDKLIRRGIKINGLLFEPGYCNSAGFEGKIIGNNLEIVYSQPLKIRVQKNELKFTDYVDCVHYFCLLRYKLPLKLSLIVNEQVKEIISHAEILDISVPDKCECKLRLAFDEVNEMPLIDSVRI